MPDVAAILAEADWLTRLARSLTGSAAEADDVVQETYVAALRSPPDPDRPVRPWLRRVATNIVRMRHRGRMRRDAREAGQLGEAMYTPDQLLERARTEQALTELVLALAEPYRSTVLLRYREGLTAEAIAAQQGVPAGTVRRRLKTALDQLRTQLDEREPTKHWRAAFAPFLAVRGKRTPWWRLVMANVMTKTGAAVIAAVVLLLAVGGGWWWWSARRAAPLADPAVVAMAHPRGSGVPAHGGDSNATAMFAQPRLGTRELIGRVTAHERPFAGASVRVIHAMTRTTVAEVQSDGDGRFAISGLPADAYVVVASASELTALPRDVELRAPKIAAVALALVGCSHLRGVVSDGSGAPIAHAQVARESTMWPVAETDALGRYDLCIHYGEAQISYTAGGYHGISAHLTVIAGSQRDVVLLPEATVAGTVVRGDGKPVADAWITIDPRGKAATRDAVVRGRTGADGTFRLAGVAPGRNEVSAVAPGLASRRIGVVVGAGETQEGLIVRVDPAAQLTGRVIANGAPLAGVRVGLRIGSVPDTALAVTQADGTFSIDRVPRGELGLLVENHRVIAPRTVSVIDRAAAVDIEVVPTGTVAGVVTLRGAPVA
ncbi:MAG: sigma-70 family RNA polymerase sigma factor, partial [Kofleriaceae bacterium]